MENRNIIITGGNAGIGLATAIGLAKKGANVFIVCRDKSKAESAVEEIKAKSSNLKVSYFLADLSAQKSIRNLAIEIKKSVPIVDVLINNAGGVFPELKRSEDGLEMTIATNHFAYFLLTNLLLENINKSDYARIINVASDSHYKGKIDFDSFSENKGYFILKAYEQSKLANVLFTNELAKKLIDTHVTVNSLHPGFVKTSIGNKGTQWYAGLLWSLATNIGAISMADGAKTSIYLASSEEVKGVSGKYFDKCKQKTAVALAYDALLQSELWRVSEQLCPIS
jgi:NAD(P)-dependent dehydrogenase (short-subunit alcohol dehydrogenase family)